MALLSRENEGRAITFDNDHTRCLACFQIASSLLRDSEQSR